MIEISVFWIQKMWQDYEREKTVHHDDDCCCCCCLWSLKMIIYHDDTIMMASVDFRCCCRCWREINFFFVEKIRWITFRFRFVNQIKWMDKNWNIERKRRNHRLRINSYWIVWTKNHNNQVKNIFIRMFIAIRQKFFFTTTNVNI